MDRDQRWDRVKLSYDVLVHGQGDKFQSATEGVTASYKAEVYDEFVKPLQLATVRLLKIMTQSSLLISDPTVQPNLVGA